MAGAKTDFVALADLSPKDAAAALRDAGVRERFIASRIAKRLGVSRATYYRTLRAHPELAKQLARAHVTFCKEQLA